VFSGNTTLTVGRSIRVTGYRGGTAQTNAPTKQMMANIGTDLEFI